VPIAGLVLIGIAVLHPVLRAGFSIIDDHEILAFSPFVAASAVLPPPPDLLTRIVVDDAEGGRVRPLYWIIRYVEIAALGPNAEAWHTLYVAMGICAAGLLYVTLGRAGVRGLPAFLSSSWLLTQPWAAFVWTHLGPQESIGTILLLMAAYATARAAAAGASGAWDYIFVVSMGAAALVKESFMLAPPALLGLRVLLVANQQGAGAALAPRALLPGLAAVAIGFVLTGLAYNTARQASVEAYAAGFLAAAGVVYDSATIANLVTLALAGGIVAPILLLGWLTRLIQQRGLSYDVLHWLAAAGIVCLLIVPQLVLYRRFGLATGRYILPAGLGLAAGLGAGILWSWNRGQWLVTSISMAVWWLLLFTGAIATWWDSRLVEANTAALSRMISALDRLPTYSTVAIAANPALHLEPAESLPYHLAATGRPDLDVRLLLTSSNPPGAEGFARELSDNFFRGRADVQKHVCGDLAAIVLFASEPEARDALPCLTEGEFHIEVFDETVGLDSRVLSPLADLFPSQTVSYSILVRE
jgi:hypothetical protein